MKVGKDTVVEEGGATTSACKVTFEDRGSLVFAQNAIVTRVALLSNETNYRLCMQVSCVTECLMKCYGEAARCRNAQQNKEWTLKWVGGGAIDHLKIV